MQLALRHHFWDGSQKSLVQYKLGFTDAVTSVFYVPKPDCSPCLKAACTKCKDATSSTAKPFQGLTFFGTVSYYVPLFASNTEVCLTLLSAGIKRVPPRLAMKA